MNILFIASNYPFPADSGHNLRTFNMLRILAKEHTIFFVGFTKPHHREHAAPDDPIPALCKSIDLFTIPDDESTVRLLWSLFLNLFSRFPYVIKKYYRSETEKRIQEILKTHSIDLVHVDILHVSMYAHRIAAIPRALTEHNIESLRVKRLAQNAKNPLLTLYLYLQYKKLFAYEKQACTLFDLCVAVSKNDLQVLQHMNPSGRMIEVPNGVDTEHFSPAPDAWEPGSLLWVGSMHDLYNREAVDYFCSEIFPRIEEEIPAVSFTAIGSHPTNALKALAMRSASVRVQGYVADVRPYFSAASVFLAPLKSGGGTKLKVLNALSLGKAVVTTRVGAEGIDVEDGVHLVIADDPTSFAQKTIELLRNPEKIKTMGEKGRQRILERYDWSAIGKIQLNAYRELVRSRISAPDQSPVFL
ncbi:MAG: glycosyltransferase [Nitrospirota bacterium]